MTQSPPHRLADDAELMRRHVAGDRDAFGELFRRHQDRLWAVAIRTLGNPDDAADALQDAMLNAFRRASSYRSESAVTTWLHRIVVNACLDKVRYAAARPAEPTAFENSSTGDDSGRGNIQPVSTADPAASAALRVDLEAALAVLPHEQRVPLVLVDMEGYSVADVAQLLDIPAGTVKSRCARARARLLPLLAPGRRTDPGNHTDNQHVSSGSLDNNAGADEGGDHR